MTNQNHSANRQKIYTQLVEQKEQFKHLLQDLLKGRINKNGLHLSIEAFALAEMESVIQAFQEPEQNLAWQRGLVWHNLGLDVSICLALGRAGCQFCIEALPEDVCYLALAHLENYYAQATEAFFKMREETILTTQPAAADAPKDVEEQIRHLSLLNDIAMLFAQADSFDSVLKIILQKISTIIDADRVSVSLLNEQKDKFRIFALQGLDKVIPLGEELTVEGTQVGLAVKRREVIHDSNITDNTLFDLRQLAKQGIHSVLNAPLIVRNEVIGTLNAGSKKYQAYREQDEVVFVQIASLLAAAVVNQQLFDKMQNALMQTKVLYDASQEMARQRDMTQFLETVYRQLLGIISVDAFFVGLYDHATNLIHYPLIYDTGKRYQDAPTTLTSGTKVAYVLETGEAACIHRSQEEIANITLSPDYAVGDDKKISASLLFVPLGLGTQTIGVLSVQSYTLNAYQESDITLLQGIASQVAVAAENIRLLQQARLSIQREQLLRKVSSRVRNAVNVDSVMRLASQEVGLALGRSTAVSFVQSAEDKG